MLYSYVLKNSFLFDPNLTAHVVHLQAAVGETSENLGAELGPGIVYQNSGTVIYICAKFRKI